MTTISRSASFNVSFTNRQLSQSQADVAQQVMQSLMHNLHCSAPELASEVQQALAMQGRPLPAMGFEGGANPFAAMSAMDPRAAMSGAGPFRDAMPMDNYWSPEEMGAGLNSMYGAGAAQLAMNAQMSMGRAQMGLIAAMQGASMQELVNLLGANNPYSRGVARRLQGLARELTRVPPNFARLSHAAQRADWSLLHHATPGNPGGRAVLKQMFRQQYGIDRPGARPYNGQGTFGNAVEQAYPNPNVPTPTGTGAGPRALSLASSQVGVREATGNNDGLPAQRYSNGRREPWCANFVAWSFRNSGNPLPGNQRRLASVQYMEDQMKANGRFIPSGSAPPKPGDVIFFGNRGQSDRGPGRHVGIVEKVENGRVYTVEGNSSNSVRRRSYPLNASRITGYGRS
jgi:hypothetical protein